MKKKSVILAILVAFSIGFISGITTVIVKGIKESKESETSQTVFSPMPREPISIELTEKIEELKEIVRLNPEDLATWVKLGNIYADHHRYREATEAYRQFLSIKPNDPDVRTSLGILYSRWGDDDGAIEEFKRAAQHDPKHANSRYYLGLTLLQNKRNIQEGIRAWEDYLKVEPKGQRANQVRVEMKKLRMVTAGDKVQKDDECR